MRKIRVTVWRHVVWRSDVTFHQANPSHKTYTCQKFVHQVGHWLRSRNTFHTQRFTIYRKFVARFTPVWLALIVTSYNKTAFNTNQRTRAYLKKEIYSRTYFQSLQKQRKLFSLLHRACWFNHFFTVPTNAHLVHSKILKSHIIILNISPYMFRSPFYSVQRKLYYEISLFGSVTSSEKEATPNISLQNLFHVHKISLNAKIMVRFGRTVLILGLN